MKTRTWIAVDHDAEEGFIDKKGHNRRSMLMRIALESPDVGVVVRPGDVKLAASVDRSRVCVGVPDVVDLEGIACGRRLTEEAFQNGVSTAKVGFYCQGDHAGPALLREFIEGGIASDVSWIFEPYCKVTKCLWDMHTLTVDLGCAAFWKLPIANVLDCRDFEEIFGSSWLLRSDGARWRQFTLGLSRASQYRCSGVMVGRAFWADLVNLPIERIRYQSSLRLAEIRKYLL